MKIEKKKELANTYAKKEKAAQLNLSVDESDILFIGPNEHQIER